MIRFYDLGGIHSIPEEELELINNQAQEGDPAACFKLAMVHLHLHDCEDYLEESRKLLIKASEGGVADADAAIAMMMIKGQLEPYEPLKAIKLLENAILRKSALGIVYQLRNIIYGRYGYKENPEMVMKTVDGLLEMEENPYWYGLKGEVLFRVGRIIESEEWFEKAVNGGLITYYSDWAVSRGCDDEGDYRDYEAYCSTALEGNDAGDPVCFYYYVVGCMENYYDIDPEDKEGRDNFRSLVIEGLEENLVRCEPNSFELLGDIYKEGQIGVMVDKNKAWDCYLRGSEFYNAACFEKMYEMLLTNEISLAKMSNEDAMDLCMINGARLHSKKLIVETVNAYKRGRLTRFAGEIEMYHIPAYDAIPDDEPLDDEDDYPDDDGRFDPWA